MIECTGHSEPFMNETVEHFSKILTDKKCVRRKKTMGSGNSRRCAHSRGTIIDKPWLTPELKNKDCTEYINRAKNKKNH